MKVRYRGYHLYDDPDGSGKKGRKKSEAKSEVLIS